VLIFILTPPEAATFQRSVDKTLDRTPWGSALCDDLSFYERNEG